MFEIGFAELLVIGVVALLALGPERLPAAARKLGATLRWARQHWEQVRAELERELDAEPIRKSLSQVPTPGTLFEPLKRETAAIEHDLNQIEGTARAALDVGAASASVESRPSAERASGPDPAASSASTGEPASRRDRE